MWISCLPSKEEYFPGELFEADITVRNVAKVPLEVELISAQLHGDFLLTTNVDDTYHYHTIRRPPISTSLPDPTDLGSRGFSIYASQAMIVECNYKFLPSEERHYRFRCYFPNHLPPTYTGNLVNVNHVLTIGTLRSQHPVQTSNISIVISSPEAALEEIVMPQCFVHSSLLPADLIILDEKEKESGKEPQQNKQSKDETPSDEKEDENEENWGNLKLNLFTKALNSMIKEEIKGDEMNVTKATVEKSESEKVSHESSAVVQKVSCPPRHKEETPLDLSSLLSNHVAFWKKAQQPLSIVLSPPVAHNASSTKQIPLASVILSSSILHRGQLLHGVIEFARSRHPLWLQSSPASSSSSSSSNTQKPSSGSQVQEQQFGCVFVSVSLDQVETLNSSMFQVRATGQPASAASGASDSSTLPSLPSLTSSHTLWKTDSDVSSAIRFGFHVALPIDRGTHQFSTTHFSLSYLLRIHMGIAAIPVSSTPPTSESQEKEAGKDESSVNDTSKQSTSLTPDETNCDLFFPSEYYHTCPSVKTDVHRFSIPITVLPILAQSLPSPKTFTFKI
ncbi:putative Rgp1 [Monocercomonoides exilis]|uniref:putative Rgp1 n=1 Tax=Monocercomonoides exilis TaxID=2049356 RepID=UPI003559FB83|nr:putative Rgp1 [Monocercomonoides exilis]|eukprot:MONOS_991.1-p1 / transcript=MONOS_991.1 / gene=MONOS_991 / organism=Monocercomonoides_exilis_PA203 / gene_product=unspecified product / transcript_product=unspecified product / location=Mono_scaffold00016:195220-197240(-) / protein_length=562 / sequence_SO=supercontig / SO=protein_coding / is_pseudo=false